MTPPLRWTRVKWFISDEVPMMGRSRPARQWHGRRSRRCLLERPQSPCRPQRRSCDRDNRDSRTMQRMAEICVVTCRPRRRPIGGRAGETEGDESDAVPPAVAVSAAAAEQSPRPPSGGGDEGITSSSQINGTAWGPYTTVEELREAYGEGRTLSAVETRELYHSLLPTQLLEHGDRARTERAQLAIKARHAAAVRTRARQAAGHDIIGADGWRTDFHEAGQVPEGRLVGGADMAKVRRMQLSGYTTTRFTKPSCRRHARRINTLTSCALGWQAQQLDGQPVDSHLESLRPWPRSGGRCKTLAYDPEPNEL